jgi:hypothetical protein
VVEAFGGEDGFVAGVVVVFVVEDVVEELVAAVADEWFGFGNVGTRSSNAAN